MNSYEQTATIVGMAAGCGGYKVTAHISASGIRIEQEAFVNSDHEYAENRAALTIRTIKRARRLYSRVYGKKAP